MHENWTRRRIRIACATLVVACSGFSPTYGDAAAGAEEASPPKMPRGYSLPVIDLAAEEHRQIVIDKEPGQYLGHPSTVLLEDGRSITGRL